MKILLEGACNARDLGGIACKTGTVQCGRLFRSGELSRLTHKDAEQLKKLGLQRVVDLRTAKEMENAPDVVLENIDYVNVSVIRATTFGITYEKSTGEEIAKLLQAGFERMKARNESYDQHMNLLYRKFVQDDHSRKAYGEFLRLLAEKPTDGATLWHCSAGKDRVGTCTALLLFCLGASEEQIFEDYMLTNQQSAESRASILNKVKPFVSQENLQIVETMLSVDESYLQDFFQQISLQFETVENFLHACGVTEEHVSLLQKNYLY